MSDHRKGYHATVNNVKANAVARDLVAFYLLDDISKLQDSNDIGLEEQLSALYFLLLQLFAPPICSRQNPENHQTCCSGYPIWGGSPSMGSYPCERKHRFATFINIMGRGI